MTPSHMMFDIDPRLPKEVSLGSPLSLPFPSLYQQTPESTLLHYRMATPWSYKDH